MTSTPTTVDSDTELSAVNAILGSIGQSPLTKLNYSNPEVALIYNIFKDCNIDTQNEGWHFNREDHIKVTPDGDGYITVPSNALRYDVSQGGIYKTKDLVIRTPATGPQAGNKCLYDKVDHTYIFTDESIDVDIVYLFPYMDIPSVYKRYITYRAASRAATQLVANPNLVQLLQNQELAARAACMEYECNQGDHSFFGWPDDSVHQSYQPYHSLRR